MDRAALSPREFAELFGKEQTWGYRQIYSGKVKTITEYGRILIPASEVERILGEAGRYDGLKPKAKKTTQKEPDKLDAWRKFVAKQRKANSAATPSGTEKPLRPQNGRATRGRSASLERLSRLRKRA